jgi:peptidyl-prolyl cis-trans isomerase A (cyclophilin A)
MKRNDRLQPLVMAILLSLSSVSVTNGATIVRFATSVGDFDVALYDDTAPNTVANFLNYVNDGDYVDSIVHRSIPGFIIQGGGYYSDLSEVPADPPINNEFGASNVRGTIAMARPADPNSATNQWYVNLVDNLHLDTQSGGFTVFGEVIMPGMNIVDQIAALDTLDLGPPFSDLPVFDVSLGTAPSNLVSIQSVAVLEPSTVVPIDIKPGSDPNSINPRSHGNIPVAIFSTDTFDATTVDPATVRLADAGVRARGRKGDLKFSFKDVNGDGLDDLFVHIDTEGLVLSADDVEAQLTGATFDGVPISGVDAIRIVPSFARATMSTAGFTSDAAPLLAAKGVPEPSTLILLAIATLGITVGWWRPKRAA